MPVLTTNRVDDGSKIYTKQIHSHDNYVIAEIIYQDKKTEYEPFTGLWICSLRKTFKPKVGFWDKKPDAPTEQQFIDAHNWCDEHLKLLNKYAVNKLSGSSYYRDK